MSNTRNSTAMIRMACAIVFIGFVFCYVYFLQTDLLAYAQHIWSGGKTRWNGMVGAVIITALLYIIQMLVASLNTLPQRLYSLSFLPSLFLLAALTSINPESSLGIVLLTPYSWLACAGVVISLVVIFALKGSKGMERPVVCSSLFSGVSLVNFALLALMMLCTVGLGNTDRTFHQRLRMEQLVYTGQYDKTLNVAKKCDGSDASMTMFCAYALMRKGELGESLFEYSIYPSSEALLPMERGQHVPSVTQSRFLFTDNERLWNNIGAVPRKEMKVIDFLHLLEEKGMARRFVPDYILTAHLIDCDLNAFASEIGKYYDITKDPLPKHFREALVLYTHLHSQRVLTYHSSVLDADYEDFLKVERRKYSSQREKLNVLGNSYSGTYWYYFYKQNNKG